MAVVAGCGQGAEEPPPGGHSLLPVYVLQFPPTQIGQTSQAHGVVRASKEALFLSPIEVEPPFSTDLVEVAKVEPRAEHTILFTFAPERVGIFSQEVEIHSTGGTHRYRLEGTALPLEPGCSGPVAYADRFVVPPPLQDVLVVVDDDPAASTWREHLATALADVPAQLSERGFDWRFAVTTTSTDEGCAGGTLLGDPPVIVAGVPGPGDTLQALVEGVDELGCEGNGAGLEAAALAAQDEAFRRKGAGLSIVALSLHDDRSPEAVEEVLAPLRSADSTGDVRMLALVGLPGASCVPDERGERWAQAVGLLGGERKSVCSPDEWEISSFLGDNPRFGVQHRYVLRADVADLDGDGQILPEADELVVEVGGRPRPAIRQDGHVNWSWDEEANAVVFSRGSAPRPGDEVEIRYVTVCPRA